MSTLKKALEKAKSERRQTEPLLPDASRAPAPPAPAQPEVPDPVYSCTSVCDVERRHLLDNRVIAREEQHPMADVYKLLRTRILHRTRTQGCNTILVTGFGPGEGKTTTAVNLAVTMARDTRQTTLLVDLDFRKPSVQRVLGLDPELPGLDRFFANGTALENVFVCPGIEKLTVLPAGDRVAQSTELMGSAKMENLIHELKLRYPDRFVIFDAPSLNDCPDPVILSQYVESILLVARADHTTRDSMKKAMELIPREKVLGMVFNAVHEAKPRSYY